MGYFSAMSGEVGAHPAQTTPERGKKVICPRFAGVSNSREDGAIMGKTTNMFSSEVRSRAMRMVLEYRGNHASR